jgi:hypothetical protein
VEKERKKAEKAKKFAEKKAKTATTATASGVSKTKEKKIKLEAKEEPLPEYVEETPHGQKKSTSFLKKLFTFWVTALTKALQSLNRLMTHYIKRTILSS